MQKLSTSKLAQTIKTRREDLDITQEQLSKLTGINRLMIGRIEREEYIPSFPQLESLSKELKFAITDLIEDTEQEDVFLAARGQARDEEKEAIEVLFSMILCIKQQIMLGSKLRDGQRI
jgi:transcriptional regulator with XRE-family HTH domain